MTIQFGGLATGLDTSSIINQLMSLERQPITRLEADKTWLNNRLAAFTQLDSKLKSFADSIKNLNDADTLLKRSVKQSSEDYLSATVSSEALAGTSYQVEVVSLAQVQKSISATGFASKTSLSFGTGSLDLTIDGTSHSIDITADNGSLEGIMRAINDADLGVSAAIINDGSGSPYRLVLTGEDVGKTFSLGTSGLSGGTDTLGDFNVDDGSGTITNPPVQAATQAHIRVDTVDIYSSSNTLTEAIPGVTLDLLQAEVGKTTSLSISLDTKSIKSTIEAFAKGYNEVVSFVTGQSIINEKGGGVLGGDSGINSIKRHLQSMLTKPFANSGVFSSLSQLGFETQKDGTLKVNDTTLSAAVSNNLDSVVSLLTGENGKDGLIAEFQDYLQSMTNSSSGMLQGRKQSINNNIKRIDNQITNMETRLEKRQLTLESQFSAMETLVSGLNSQGSYLSQQMTILSNMMSGSN
ncbi:flagellar hook-associated 2 domain-containing protein [Desulfobulbus propionicus DSM 2032]|jgi:flagellar hook-associated protein 2|uniref:Flagellar hook-associated protein 2 n=1 Tax=Desulfobulbus propionicus (strain ATCC 33891 / DSM 2032 / VKM B-1956 / 1pr3) TaxID=577650 RepID=A0A7U4DPM5_DESPD|nr:flagellar filament capping protein FliD [Desulfobulbus propionicus]ADW18311.1 flagellar hook-associated 2 domain-containing protein [Desulfobulbus propionicus DSM 2032]